MEFIIPKFIEGTCFERHTAHHQELQTVFAASGLYTHVVTGRCPGWELVPTQPGQRPVTTWVYKPEACKYSLKLLLMSGMPLVTCAFNNFGIINSITSLHLVGYFY